MTAEHEWLYTTEGEFPSDGDDLCVYVGAGDDCYCQSCARHDAEHERAVTETYWRARIAAETAGRHRRSPIGTMNREDERKPERDAIARAIADSEALMWLMVGANHPEAHLQNLRRAYEAYTLLDGGYGRWSQRQIPLDPEDVTAALRRLTAGATPVEVMTGMTTDELDTLGGEPK